MQTVDGRVTLTASHALVEVRNTPGKYKLEASAYSGYGQPPTGLHEKNQRNSVGVPGYQ